MSSGLHSDVVELLAERCEAMQLPGASLAYFHDGQTQFASHGVTDVNDGAPVRDTTMFGIGSTSKTLTATAVMALVERGTLSLDDAVVKHLPGLPVLDEQARDTVTVGQLLDHTAGWVGDGSADTGWGEDALARAIQTLLGKASQQAPPGALFSYNNNAVTVAGHLVATLHESSFEDAIRDLVLKPLGMTSTFYLVWQLANR
ncbi:MAG TPA: serine hydrolase domain-containing protein, partial [Mycobacteriales bacterium]|nr:serine hydrolase domain-containing protein [Mycobacteriales bacterium]